MDQGVGKMKEAKVHREGVSDWQVKMERTNVQLVPKGAPTGNIE